METRRLWMMWWAGLFSLVTFVHLLRALSHVPLVVGVVHIPVWLSWVIFPLTGIAAGWLMRRAFEAPPAAPPWTPWEQVGGLHPKASIKTEELQHAGPSYCGVRIGYHFVGEDDEAE